MIKWNCTKTDRALIKQIVTRAAKDAQELEIDYPTRDIEMDVTAAHCNGCPLDLEKLLHASDADFGHDIFGIRRFIDRTTGRIDSGKFHPRCSLPAILEAAK